MPDKGVGLVDTYQVERAIHAYQVARLDGKPVGWCFVLEEHDPLAVGALFAYCEAAAATGYDVLAADLEQVARVLAQRTPLLLRLCGECPHEFGQHFATLDGLATGCAGAATGLDGALVRCACEGFAEAGGG